MKNRKIMHQNNAPNTMITITQEESIVLEKMIIQHGVGEVIKEMVYICSQSRPQIDLTKEIAEILR